MNGLSGILWGDLISSFAPSLSGPEFKKKVNLFSIVVFVILVKSRFLSE